MQDPPVSSPKNVTPLNFRHTIVPTYSVVAVDVADVVADVVWLVVKDVVWVLDTLVVADDVRVVVGLIPTLDVAVLVIVDVIELDTVVVIVVVAVEVRVEVWLVSLQLLR